MPPVFYAIADIGAKALFVAVGASRASVAVAFAAGATVIAAGVAAVNTAVKALLPDFTMPQADTDRTRQQTVRGTIEPQKVVYGEALVSGPIFFVGVAGTDNDTLYHSIALTGHEVEDITDIYFDNERIADTSINVSGQVTTGS